MVILLTMKLFVIIDDDGGDDVDLGLQKILIRRFLMLIVTIL